MKKRRMVLVLGMIIMIIVLTACIAVRPVFVPEERYRANYDKMFEAAIDAGTSIGYHVEFKDKERGMIKLQRKFISTTYRIVVQFGKLQSHGGKLGFKVFGQTEDILNPFVKKEVQHITDAISKAAESGTSTKESQPTAIPPSPPPTATKPQPKPEPTISKKTEKPGVVYLLTIKNSNIRTKPTTKSQIITTIKKGTKLEKISESTNWFEVRLPSGKTGHIYKPLVIVMP